ncbi:P-II family nitrogen regulator [Marinithermus hydrothermalis]
MKKVEIIVRGEDLNFVLDLLEKADVSGYTIVHL